MACVAVAGHATVAEEVEDKELRQLLEAREAAYLTLVMGVNRWQDIMQLYEHLKKLRKHIFCQSSSAPALPALWCLSKPSALQVLFSMVSQNLSCRKPVQSWEKASSKNGSNGWKP